MHIKLDKFKPREYQKPLLDAFEKNGFKRLLAIWPRRSGKDVVGFNMMFCAALRKVGTYFYVFPTFSSGRRILWDAINNDGMKVLDYIPHELVADRNEQLMRIRLINGSVIQVIGSDNYNNSIVGTNPQGMIFSEYALQDPNAYIFSRPILSANDGWACFLSTPRGKNSLFELYNIALNNPDIWFTSKLTVDDTQHITKEALEQERIDMSEDMIQQEWYCSFTMGVEGSYYNKYIDRMRLNNQIGDVSWDPSHKVHTSWDIGVRDSTSIIFFQQIGVSVRLIDFYERSKEGLEHYVKIIKEKPYEYGKHIAPHDIQVREFSSGMSRIDKARNLGINFTVARNIPIMDGIEVVRSTLGHIYIDKTRCKQLIRAIENYRQEFDPKKKVYSRTPLHNEFSHANDALRYLCISLPRTSDRMTAADIDKLKSDALGVKDALPGFFR
jgi:hypothetical protein